MVRRSTSARPLAPFLASSRRSGSECLRRPPLEWIRRAGNSLAIYEIEAEDPHKVIKTIGELAYTDAMPISDALGPVGVQFLVEEIASFNSTP